MDKPTDKNAQGKAADTKAHMFTTPEEDALIEAEFRDVLDGYLASNHRKKVEIVERAFNFAKEAH